MPGFEALTALLILLVIPSIKISRSRKKTNSNGYPPPARQTSNEVS